MTYSNLLFVAAILPLSVLAAMFDRSTEYKNLILCLTSLLFIVWGKSFSALVILLSVVADFFLAIAAEGSRERSRESSAVFMVMSLIMNACIFIVYTHNAVFAADSPLHLRQALIPVGVAFYTLKNFSYVYDVFSGRIKAERNIFCLFTYSISYPFLLAGPVVRYGDIEPQIRSRSIDHYHLNAGITDFAVGFAKMALVVPVLTRLFEAGLDPSEPTLAGAWLGMIAFFGAAYFTLMGLSDMGTGIARMNGFDVGKNYTPLTTKYMLGGLVKSYNTSMVQFLRELSGGRAFLLAALAFVGAAYYAQHRFTLIFAAVIAVMLAIESLTGYEKLERIPWLIKTAAVFAASMLLFSAFAFESFGDWSRWLMNLFGRGNLYTLSTSVKYIIINNCWLLAVAFVAVTPLGRLIGAFFDKCGKASPVAYGRVRTLKTLCTALLLILSYVITIAQTAGV